MNHTKIYIWSGKTVRLTSWKSQAGDSWELSAFLHSVGKEPSCVNNTKTPPFLQKEGRYSRWTSLLEEKITLKVRGFLTSGDWI